METLFQSNYRKISDQLFSDHIEHVDIDASVVELYDISLRPNGHGHYKITCMLDVDNERVEFSTSTNKGNLINAWKDGEDYFNASVHFDTWNEVCEHMLNELNIEDELYSL